MAGRKSKRNRRALQESRSASRISRSPVDSATEIDTVCKTIDQESQGYNLETSFNVRKSAPTCIPDNSNASNVLVSKSAYTTGDGSISCTNAVSSTVSVAVSTVNQPDTEACTIMSERDHISVRRPAHHTTVLPVSSDTVPFTVSSCTGRPEIMLTDTRVMQTGSYPEINSSPYMTPALPSVMQTTGPMLRLPTNTYTSGLTQSSVFVPASSNQPLWSDQSFAPISYNSASRLSTVTSSAVTTTWSHIRCQNNHLPVGSFTGSVPVSSCAGYAGNLACASMTEFAQRPDYVGFPTTHLAGSEPVMASQDYTRQIPVPIKTTSGSVGVTDHTALNALTDIVRQLQTSVERLAENDKSSKSQASSDSAPLPLNVSSDSDTSRPELLRRRPSNRTQVKIPPYTGKEDWTVWFCRFEEVGDRYKWSTDEKLDQLLPRLHDDAADFVFGQLSKDTRSSYKKLTKELTNRFRAVETRRTYLAKFNKRVQKPGERVEDFAADLKRLYTKAHPERDSKTRDEDLLRKFLDGLADRDAQFHVEYVKDPRDIHEAVLQVTNYEEAGRHPSPKRCARETKSRADTDTGSDDQQATQKSKAKPKVRNTTLHKGDNFHRSKDTIQALQRQMGEIQKCLDALVKNKDYNNQPAVPSVISSSTPSTGVTHNQTTVPNGPMQRSCYYCKGGDHFIRECPLRIQELQKSTTKPLNRN